MKNLFHKIVHRKKSLPPPKYNPSNWLSGAQQFDSNNDVRVQLIEIFSAPDVWWDQFILHCEDILRQQYRHLEQGAIPLEWKEEMWNTYLPEVIVELRREYGIGLKRQREKGVEEVMGANEIRKCVNWIMFCLGELKGMGYECVW